MLSCVRTTNPKKSKVTISYPGAMLNILVQVPETTLSPPPIPFSFLLPIPLTPCTKILLVFPRIYFKLLNRAFIKVGHISHTLTLTLIVYVLLKQGYEPLIYV